MIERTKTSLLTRHTRAALGLKQQTSYANPPSPNAAGPRVITAVSSRGSYSGEELRPFDGRPGAMDAFKIQSRRSP